MRIRKYRILGTLLTGLTLYAALGVRPAQADVWAYIDTKGSAHFSTIRLDERYELFFKSGESFDSENFNTGTQPNTGPKSTGSAQAKLLAYFEVSPHYKAVQHLLREASQVNGIDYALLQALIATESGFDARVVSPKGAVGLMQLIPATATRYGVQAERHLTVAQKLTDPQTNIRAGARYLRDLIRLFPGQLDLALAAYNAGENAVHRAGKQVPPYPETLRYVKTVMQLYQHLKPPSGLKPGGRIRMEMMGGSTRAEAPNTATPVPPPAAQEPGL